MFNFYTHTAQTQITVVTHNPVILVEGVAQENITQ